MATFSSKRNEYNLKKLINIALTYLAPYFFAYFYHGFVDSIFKLYIIWNCKWFPDMNVNPNYTCNKAGSTTHSYYLLQYQDTLNKHEYGF